MLIYLLLLLLLFALLELGSRLVSNSKIRPKELLKQTVEIAMHPKPLYTAWSSNGLKSI